MNPTSVNEINWVKEWVDFILITLATGLGVFAAFKLDNWRERTKLRAKKLKLIQSLMEELDVLAEYVRQNPILQKYSDYHLQTDVIVETIKDQLDFFDQKTNKLLKQIRNELILIDDELAEWAELNKSAIGTGTYPTQNHAFRADRIMHRWNGLFTTIPSGVAALKKELEKERVET